MGARPTNFYRKISVGRGLCAPPKRKNIAPLHFAQSAAAAQTQRRFYIQGPLHGTLKRVERTKNNLKRAGRAKESKTLVLAAFFGYFLSPKKESNPPEAQNPIKIKTAGEHSAPRLSVYSRFSASSRSRTPRRSFASRRNSTTPSTSPTPAPMIVPCVAAFMS